MEMQLVLLKVRNVQFSGHIYEHKNIKKKNSTSLTQVPYICTYSKTKLRGFGSSDRRLSAKLVSDRGCRVVSATDPHSR
jgi:hypothetical protein